VSFDGNAEPSVKNRKNLRPACSVMPPGPSGDIPGRAPGLSAIGDVDEPPVARRFRSLAAVGAAAARLGRDVAWD
jgi:hypothetical protein